MIAIGIYLYRGSRTERKEDTQEWSLVKLVKDFTFTWILVGLLIFYVTSIKIGSSIIFAIGNIVVEIILILYVISRSRVRASRQKKDKSKENTEQLTKVVTYTRVQFKKSEEWLRTSSLFGS
jgi:energy-converting hydrogenase Eha subunit G